MAASQFPKNRETRAIKSSELKVIDEVKELLPEKHHYLIDGPDNDLDGSPLVIRYNKNLDIVGKLEFLSFRWHLYFRCMIDVFIICHALFFFIDGHFFPTFSQGRYKIVIFSPKVHKF